MKIVLLLKKIDWVYNILINFTCSSKITPLKSILLLGYHNNFRLIIINILTTMYQ